MKAFPAILLLCFAAAPLAGCFEPIQSGGVMIVGDPSERLEALCRFGRQGAGSFCASEVEVREDLPLPAAVAPDEAEVAATPSEAGDAATPSGVPADRQSESAVPPDGAPDAGEPESTK